MDSVGKMKNNKYCFIVNKTNLNYMGKESGELIPDGTNIEVVGDGAVFDAPIPPHISGLEVSEVGEEFMAPDLAGLEVKVGELTADIEALFEK